MHIDQYLHTLSNHAFFTVTQLESINKSIVALGKRLKEHFGQSMLNGFVFGSYSRRTILPRSMDQQSDVDYMIVFKDDELRPQSYLDRLRGFAEKYYSTSEIEQSHPTIVLSLDHIRFEIVPALQGIYSFKIPAKASSNQEWIYTNPYDFNNKLINTNQRHNNLIIPLVKIIKYWNANNNYPFESYKLEQQVSEYNYLSHGLFSIVQLSNFFYQISLQMNSINISIDLPAWKELALSRLRTIVSQAFYYENVNNPYQAIESIKKLLPPTYTMQLLGQ